MNSDQRKDQRKDQKQDQRYTQRHTQRHTQRDLSRRAFLRRSSALSTATLCSLATGLPVGFLLNPQSAHAQASGLITQSLILSTSSRGDPINVNCPGSYTDGVLNNPGLPSARAQFGGQRVRAAQVWCDLPGDLRSRLAFFHYASGTAAHPEYARAMTLHGAVKNVTSNGANGVEMFASAMSQLAYSPMTHLQAEPIPLCDSTLTFQSQPLQQIKPVDIKSLFSPADAELADLRETRDRVLDSMYSQIRAEGTSAQRDFIDRYALSRSQARTLGEQLGDLLERLPTDADEPNTPLDEVLAAVALARLNISPVITINIPFGRDNHQDAGLITERDETISGVALINTLWDELKSAQIEDRVSFATLNVFGRRSYTNSRGGRDHNQHHAVMVGFGRYMNGGVYGGMDADGAAIDVDGVNAADTLPLAGKSLARALGHSAQDVELRIPDAPVSERFLNLS